jgi:KaiC/GvpD/RAD55 family RecA-like ATPase
MDRVGTGIPGLDQLIGGGIPKGFNVLVSGRPGTGKTILALQYLCEGAKKGENGLYITVDANSHLVREQGKAFGWDIEKLEADKKIYILDVPLNMRQRLSIFTLIQSRIKEYNIKRIVFDSLSSFIFNMNQFVIDLPTIDTLSNLSKSDKEYFEYDIMNKQPSSEGLDKIRPDPAHFEVNPEKRVIYLLFREFSMWGTTNFIVTSSSAENSESTVDGVSEFVSDGLIRLESIDLGGGPARTVKIPKMRYTKNSLETHNFEISERGIVVT